MLRNLYWSAVLLLCGVAGLALPGSAWAQHAHGSQGNISHFGHVGTVHGGGFRPGGLPGGGHSGNFHASQAGGFNHGGVFLASPHGFYRHVSPGFGFGFGYAAPFYGYGYGYDYPAYMGSYPYAYTYPPNGLYTDSYPDMEYGLGSGTISGDVMPSVPASSAPTPAVADDKAHLIVRVPADAQVWFDGTATTSTGAVREFDTPPLVPGRRYTYDVKATWMQDGQEVTRTQSVRFSAGDRIEVLFPAVSKVPDQPVPLDK
jgi:uncharacterized protein (TIGR03000 family)